MEAQMKEKSNVESKIRPNSGLNLDKVKYVAGKIGAGIGNTVAVAAVSSVLWGPILAIIMSEHNIFPNYEYRYKGNIAGEQVYFHENWSGSKNFLDVRKMDGTRMHFVDYGDGDYKEGVLDYLTIDSKAIDYKFAAGSSDPDVKEAMQMGQEMYNSYLEKIVEQKKGNLAGIWADNWK